jgi:hypothetical protein
LRNDLLSLVLPLAKLIEHSNVVLFEGVINGLSHCSVASNKFLHYLSVVLGLLAVTLVILTHGPEEFVLLLLDQTFQTGKLTFCHFVVSLVCVCELGDILASLVLFMVEIADLNSEALVGLI